MTVYEKLQQRVDELTVDARWAEENGFYGIAKAYVEEANSVHRDMMALTVEEAGRIVNE